MANISISSTYAGEAATPMISATLFQGKTLANNWIKIRTDVRNKVVLQKFDTNNLIQAYAASFNDSGTITKAETVLTVTDLMINKEFPKKQLESDWRSSKYTGGATAAIDTEFVQYAADYFARKGSEQLEFNLWRGNMTGATATISGYTLFDGIYRKIDTGSPVRVTATAITRSNVFEMFDAVYNAMLQNISQVADQDICFYVSPKTGGLFAQRQTVNDTSRGAITSAGVMSYLGKEVRVCPGALDDVIVLANPERINFGTVLVDDFNNVHIKDMLDSTLDLNVRFRIDFKAGVAIDYASEIVYFK